MDQAHLALDLPTMSRRTTSHPGFRILQTPLARRPQFVHFLSSSISLAAPHTLTYCPKTRKPKMDKWFFIRSLFVWLNALIFAGRFHRMFSGWRKRQKVNVHRGNRWMFYGIHWKETRNKFPSIACTLYTYRLLAYGLYLFQFPTEIHRYVWDVIIVIVKWVIRPFFLRFSIRCVGVYLLLICGSFWHIVTKWLARVRGIKTSWTTSHSVSESISMWRFAPSLIFISTFVTRNRQMN